MNEVVIIKEEERWGDMSTNNKDDMEPITSFRVAFLLTLFIVNSWVVTVVVVCADPYTRDDFPPDFIFGAGSSAYQVEGAAIEDGRTPSIWDTFAHAGYKHGDNGDVACDEYYKYKEDVQLLVETGLDAYRFSISWSRLLPNGRGPINPMGLQYYNNLINELVNNGIQPHVTLHHYDLPQALEDEYGGWLSRDIIKDFTNYADMCFREFGDRVLYWTTVNEPNVFAMSGYDKGVSPPQRCSAPFGLLNCTRGNSTLEHYLVVHHILLAHSSAVRLYRKKYRDKQHGFIGISVFQYGLVPQTDTEKDRAAIQRVRDFYVGWIVEPLVYGDYPISMKKNAGARLPTFTKRESKQLKGSYDFIGLVFYTNKNVTDRPDFLEQNLRDFDLDMAAEIMYQEDLTSNKEFPIEPWGLLQEMDLFKLLYGNPPLFIYENGQRTPSNSSLQDVSRVKYMHGHIGAVLDALRNGSNTMGYFAWSFLDAFELLDGYRSSYGLYYVDRDDLDLKRYPKLSAKWYSLFLRSRSTSKIGLPDIELTKDPSIVSISHLLV